jgi:hypothetical protein
MWKKKGLIYNVKNQFEWDVTHAHVVSVDFIEEKNMIRMIFSTRNSNNQCLPCFIDVDANTFELINDISKKPLFDLGKIGTFDDSGIMPTWLYRHGNERFLYYIGWTVRNTIPYHNSIGIAKSNDGFKYEKIFEGPIVTSNYLEPYFVASACILKNNDLFLMWYLSCIGWEIINDKPEPLYNIKLATSIDGINWIRGNNVCINLKNDEGGISRPTVIFEEGIYKMWYSYRGRKNFKIKSDQSYRIGYAESNDGINWSRMDEKSGINISDKGWDSDMIEYPLVFILKNKKYMIYNGNGFGKSGFGYAVWN